MFCTFKKEKEKWPAVSDIQVYFVFLFSFTSETLALVTVHTLDFFLMYLDFCCLESRPETIFSDYKYLGSLVFSFLSPFSEDLYQLAKVRMWFISCSVSWLYSWFWYFVIIITLWKLGFSVFPAPPLYMLSPSLNWGIIIWYRPSSSSLSTSIIHKYFQWSAPSVKERDRVCACSNTTVVVGIRRFGLGRLNKSMRVLACVWASARVESRSWNVWKDFNSVNIHSVCLCVCPSTKVEFVVSV